ncbi:MAG: ATP-binding cassette domain-containing protein [Desulfobacterales bacterium]|nr:ATP-binding cassette domain-containing protein [Desulfobacterales bacterium]
MGPDGAGDNHLRILSTVMEQKRRRQVMGYDVRKAPEKARRHIGYMPQNFSLYPDLSVLENLNFFADIQQVPANVRKGAHRRDAVFHPVGEFCKPEGGCTVGRHERSLLACALVHSPAVLLLDGPSTGVDPVSRRELWAILANVVQQGVTIVVSTPYMDEAERCHKVSTVCRANAGEQLSGQD